MGQTRTRDFSLRDLSRHRFLHPIVIPAVFSGNPEEGYRNPASLTTDAAYTRPRCGGEKTLDFLCRGNDEGVEMTWILRFAQNDILGDQNDTLGEMKLTFWEE